MSSFALPASLDFFGEDKKKESVEVIEEVKREVKREVSSANEASEEEVNWLRRRLRIKVEGDDVPMPWTSWSLPLRNHENILAGIEESRWIEPTAIQMQCGPIILSGRDCLAMAPTGSGKTGAFLIPLAVALERSKDEKALILAPTRELVSQLTFEVDRILKNSNARDRILVRTPNPSLGKDRYRYLILDEADKLLDVDSGSLSFVDQAIASSACICFFSASITTAVKELAATALADSMLSVSVLSPHETTESLPVTQRLLFVGRGDDQSKFATLRELILSGALKPPSLLFVNGTTRAHILKDKLQSITASLTSSRVNILSSTRGSLQERETIIRDFRSGRIWYLIATDLASRGLDFRALNSVLNYDVPISATDYLHRTGRVGRAGRAGTAITLFTENDLNKCDLRAIANLALRSGAKPGLHLPEWLLRLPKKKKKNKNTLLTTRNSNPNLPKGGPSSANDSHDVKPTHNHTTSSLLPQRPQQEAQNDTPQKKKEDTKTKNALYADVSAPSKKKKARLIEKLQKKKKRIAYDA